jgi:hypothetical protein
MAKAAETVLQAKTSFTAAVDGARFEVHQGDLIDADHPAVRKWPEAFGPVFVHHRSAAGKVEQATAAPGEKRGA